MLRAGQTSLLVLAEPALGANDVRSAVLCGLPKSEPDMLRLLCLAGSLRRSGEWLIALYCHGPARWAPGATNVRLAVLGRLLGIHALYCGVTLPAPVSAHC